MSQPLNTICPFPSSGLRATQGNHLCHPPVPPSTDSYPPSKNLAPEQWEGREQTPGFRNHLSKHLCTYHCSAEGPASPLNWTAIPSPKSFRSPKETSTRTAVLQRPRQQPRTMGQGFRHGRAVEWGWAEARLLPAHREQKLCDRGAERELQRFRRQTLRPLS